MSAEVFVSYARVDRARVLQLVERMRSAGVGVWIDEGGIHGASLWGQEIVDAIESARVMVLMLSDASITSDNVVKELSIASEDKKPILPVYLHQAEIPKSMRYQLAGIQHIEYYEGNEEVAFRSMCAALSRLGVTNDGEGDASESVAPATAHRPEPATRPSAGSGNGKWVRHYSPWLSSGWCWHWCCARTTRPPRRLAKRRTTNQALPVKPSRRRKTKPASR